MSHRTHRLAISAALIIGLGLVAAPIAFQMFHRAPLGGEMIDEFRPYMVNAKIDAFRGYMDQVDAAVSESADLRTRMIDSGTVTESDFAAKYPGAVTLQTEWQTINTDMTDLLDRMDANMDNYAAVDALPPFAMFPWFFVLPGVMVAGVAGYILWSGRRGRARRGATWALLALGLGIVAAPAIFQMFTRAPLGGQMIDEFRPMMTHERVQTVQRSFITLGGGEGQLRVAVLPAYEATGGSASDFPAIQTLSDQWPTIVSEFNPMIATMGDNVDNFEAVDAMPSFPLFPWFFVVPGALVALCAGIALRPTSPHDSQSEADTP